MYIYIYTHSLFKEYIGLSGSGLGCHAGRADGPGIDLQFYTLAITAHRLLSSSLLWFIFRILLAF